MRFEPGWSRLWPALVLAFFCLPLVVGLGRTDLGNDEAIYSFAVDRMIETGDWLVPRSSPTEDGPFLEKPPLKLWIVAASIRLGLTPHDEFGLRFWDAVFGSVAFLYVFAIGRRLAGPVCGVVAVFLLFVHEPLIFDHGLRSNNMEAALLLSYCGGVYHYLKWAEAGERRRWHVAAVALWFVLGFMTKFVAALFLPLVLGASALLTGARRAQVRRDWRLWFNGGLLAVALCAPWFIYAWAKFGTVFWEVIVGGHVYARFTSFVDPLHVQPWHYYVSGAHHALMRAQSEVLVGIGLALLVAQTIRRRSAAGLVILLWFVLPVTLISLGTSKLYHYLYPFLPPLALAGGYAPALLLSAVQARAGPFSDRWRRRLGNAVPWLAGHVARPVPRLVLTGTAAAALLLAAATALNGSVRLEVGGWTLLRNGSIVRPALVALAAAALAAHPRRVALVGASVLLLAVLPMSSYRGVLVRLPVEDHPLRSTQACLADAFARAGQERTTRPSFYLDAGDVVVLHPVYYYLRQLRPWARASRPSDPALYEHLYVRGAESPVLLPDWRQRQFMTRLRSSGPEFIEEIARVSRVDPADVRARATGPSPAQIDLQDAVLLLPGPYAACAAQAGRLRIRP